MRLTVCISLLLLAAGVQAEFSKEKQLKTEKRALTEGNAGLRKRAPALPTVSSSANAGVEYADTKQPLPDKSPSQQVYATPSPVPQITKISDLLASHGPTFQDAIANQLFSPLPAYQPRAGGPTYEVSAPVPSQLAYSEHRIGYQHPNAISYNPQDYTLKLPKQPEYNQQQLLSQQQLLNQQQILSQQQLLSQHQQLSQPQQIFNQQAPIQPIFQQIPQSNYQPQPVAYNQQPIQYSSQAFKQFETQQPLQGFQYQQPARQFFQENQQNILPAQYNLTPQPQQYYEPQQQYQQPAYVPQPLQNVQIPQPGITYARQEETPQKIFSQPAQNQIYEKPQFGAQNYQTQPRGPVSYTSFPHSHSNPSIIHHPFTQQPAANPGQEAQGSNNHERPSYFRQGPQLQLQSQVQPQYQQAQQAQQSHYSKPTAGQAQTPIAPTFPAVQYFGKYAQSIFNKPQH